MIPTGKTVILFDGVCNFCNASVDFIVKRDRRKTFVFAALQSRAGQELLRRFNMPTSDFDTLVLVEGGVFYTKSTAGLRIARCLSGPWPLLYVFMVVPRGIRDAVYGVFARNRYRWFGKRDACRVPSAELRERFLE